MSSPFVAHIDPIYSPGARSPIEHTTPTPPQQSMVPSWEPYPSHQNLAQWMSNYMRHVGHDRITGQPVHVDKDGQHYIAQAGNTGGYTPQGRESGDEPPLPQDPGEPEPTPLPNTGGEPYHDPRTTPQPWNNNPYNLPPNRGPHNDPYGIDPASEAPYNAFNHWYYQRYGVAPSESGDPWENQAPFFEGGYRSISNPGGGFVPDLGGAQAHFTGNPSQYSTSWTYQPDLGWVPRAQAVDSGGEYAGGAGGNFGGGNHVPSSGGQVGVGTNTTPGESTIGRVARYAPYIGPIASLVHGIAGYQRRHGSGTVGGAAHAVGRPAATQAAPQSGLSAILAQYPHLNTPAGIRAIQSGANPNQLVGRSQFDAHANAMQLMASTANAGRANRNLVDDNLLVANAEHGPTFRGAMTPRAMAEFERLYGRTGVHTNAAMTGGG